MKQSYKYIKMIKIKGGKSSFNLADETIDSTNCTQYRRKLNPIFCIQKKIINNTIPFLTFKGQKVESI